MLNIEKYIDELIEMGVIDADKLGIHNGKPIECHYYKNKDCRNCDIRKDFGRCMLVAKEWLFSEYKEPEVDWSKVKIDTPILVKDTEEEEWQRRYFAEFENGKVYAWHDGLTSWSAVGGCKRSWKYAKIAESEG